MKMKWITFKANDVGTDATNCLPEQLEETLRNLRADGFEIVNVLDGDEAGAEQPFTLMIDDGPGGETDIVRKANSLEEARDIFAELLKVNQYEGCDVSIEGNGIIYVETGRSNYFAGSEDVSQLEFVPIDDPRSHVNDATNYARLTPSGKKGAQ